MQIVESERVSVRLGHQVFLSGRLASAAMDAAVRAFVHFRERMEALGVEHHRAVATSAVREARNGDLLVDRVFRESGIRLEVITGSEEARLVHRAVAARVDLRGGIWVLVDLGGGSVEVSLVDDMGIIRSESHSMGAVRLLEEVASGTGDPRRLQTLLTEYISVLKIPAAAQYWSPAGFIATGGNAEALGRLGAAGLDAQGVSRLRLRDLESLIQVLTRLSYRERIQQFDLKEDRADVILPASMVYQKLAELSGAEEILIPQVGVKEGLLLDLAEELASGGDLERVHEAQLTRAAVSLGRRFMFDEAHGVHVARLAGLLFDRLQPLHGMDARDRMLLQGAAILHDVGTFISHKKHHRHSLYLIAKSELPGLSPEENLLVANIARYHRKSHPQPHHAEYMALAPEARVRVDQLAALLRIADALDRQHRQRVETLEVDLRGLDLHLTLRGEGDLLLERWAVSRKQGLFEETFGVRVWVTPDEEEPSPPAEGTHSADPTV
jgi:exopolyphosphatase / guanosine-5'-triphosphate,3'-diphosphate pyrophosphatase